MAKNNNYVDTLTRSTNDLEKLTELYELKQLEIRSMIATRNNRQSSRAHTCFIIMKKIGDNDTGENIIYYPLFDKAGTENMIEMNEFVDKFKDVNEDTQKFNLWLLWNIGLPKEIKAGLSELKSIDALSEMVDPKIDQDSDQLKEIIEIINIQDTPYSDFFETKKDIDHRIIELKNIKI